MSMYQQFRQDEEAEKKGIVLDYGDFRLTVGRAGGANKKFRRAFESRMRPYQRAMDIGALSDDIKVRVLRESYADAIVFNWETKNGDGTWHPGIEGADGAMLPFNWDNVVATFAALPELFQEVVNQTREADLFRAAVREEAVKNSLGASSTP
jgi:hypothetical protein